jgi:hypothetical protein
MTNSGADQGAVGLLPLLSGSEEMAADERDDCAVLMPFFLRHLPATWPCPLPVGLSFDEGGRPFE